MIVWITHAKVGHRQTPIKQKAQPCVGLSALWNLICDLLEVLTTRRAAACCGGDSYRLHRCDGGTKVGHGLDAVTLAGVQAQVRGRILRAFVRRGLIDERP